MAIAKILQILANPDSTNYIILEKDLESLLSSSSSSLYLKKIKLMHMSVVIA